jgi:1-acyl-sn-glycerol-3-phosphate acyltransferase
LIRQPGGNIIEASEPIGAADAPAGPAGANIDFSKSAVPGWAIRSTLGVNRFVFRVYHDLRVVRPCPIPPQGPAILICNHTSGLDPCVIQSAIPHRIIVWMMAGEYYELPQLNWFFRAVQAIPVQRQGRDTSALRHAARALEHGRIVGIFPEGRIEPDDRLMPLQQGVATLAAKSRCDIYPAYLDGTQRRQEMIPAFFEPQEATLNFGAPVVTASTSGGDSGTSNREARHALYAQIVSSMQALREQTLKVRRRVPTDI